MSLYSKTGLVVCNAALLHAYENSLKFVLLEVYNIKFWSKEFNSNWAMRNIED